MVYSMLKIFPTSGIGASIPLNEEREGWVAQILNGSFGVNKEYNFTGNVVTTVTDKPIDINVRLTPTVPIPEKPARYFLDVLANGSDLTVQLVDNSVKAPSINYKLNETNTYTKPSILFNRKVIWKQDCVVREIKYNYSDRPATIEFTITTKNPVLYGPEFSLYMGLGNQTWPQSITNTQEILDNLYTQIGYLDIIRLRIGLPPVGNTGYQIFNRGLTQFHAYVNGSSTTENGLFDMNKSPTGGRLFNISGGYQALSSLCYSSEAYPAISVNDISAFMKNFSRQPAKFNIPNYGSCFVAMDLVMMRKGL
jgi:hypothetical protein|nr:MAG TPA: hypothetical protein [Caudoviricetes sp.]